MMRLIPSVLLGLLFFAGPFKLDAAEMRASTAAVRREVVAVVEAQLAHFRKGEIADAYAIASAPLRAQRTQPVFAAMVEANYPEIWTSTRAEFGVVRDDGTRASVVVQVYSANGDASYNYTMVKEAGRWRVHGVLRHASKKNKA
jgi:hypothetical protein